MTRPQHDDAPERTVRVLVVDDSAAYRDAAATVVRRVPGFEVAGAASSGDEAVRSAAELEPDAVLMDVRMDSTNGVDATRAILAQRPQTVVVLMTAQPGSTPADAEACGAVALVDKRELSPDTLERLWREHRPRRA